MTVKINAKDTNIDMWLNNINKTLTRETEIPIRSILNISINYYGIPDGITLSGADVSISGIGGSPVDMTYTNGWFQYNLNVSDLGLGIHFLSVLATLENYEQYSIPITLTVLQIPTNVSTWNTNTTIEIDKNNEFEVKIFLEDLVTKELIRGANVSYSYLLGEGYLVDPDGDGYYSANLTIAKPGTYTIYISVFKGIEYKFETFEVVVSVVDPNAGGFPWWVMAILIGVIVGLIGWFIAYQVHFKYPAEVRTVRKLNKNIRRDNPEPVEPTKDRNESYSNLYLDDVQRILPRSVKKQLEDKMERRPEDDGIAVKQQISEDVEKQDKKTVVKETVPTRAEASQIAEASVDEKKTIDKEKVKSSKAQVKDLPETEIKKPDRAPISTAKPTVKSLPQKKKTSKKSTKKSTKSEESSKKKTSKNTEKLDPNNKKLQKKFEDETGKNAVYRGKVTKNYLKWLNDQK